MTPTPTPTALQPDPEQAADFLSANGAPGHPLTLTVIRGESVITRLFTPTTDRRPLVAFIADHNPRKYNIYWQPNPTRPDLQSRAEKADIVALAYVHADLDPATDAADLLAERRRLRTELEAAQPAPQLIVDSGNGYQGLWRLPEPVPLPSLEVAARLEGYNRTAAVIYGGDKTAHDVSRLLRVPCTINWPTPRKLKLGRVPVLAEVARADPGATSLDRLPRFPDHFLDLLKADKVLRARWTGDPTGLDDASRSGFDISMAGLLKARGFSEGEAFAIWRHWRFGKGPDGGTERDFTRAWTNSKAEPGPPPTAPAETAALITEFNARYAVVQAGDKGRVLQEHADGSFTLLAPSEFKFLHSHRTVALSPKRQVAAAEVWLGSPLRRQFAGIVFEPEPPFTPGTYNLFRGWAVTPAPGDCGRFLAHVRENVCGGDERLYRWVMAWFAQLFQQPGRKPGTALVLRGKQGTGKTIVGKLVGRLLGVHYALVASGHRVTGKFNALHERLLLLQADEAFFAGDHATAGALKDMVTNPTQFIERKGVDAFPVANHLRLLITSNATWAVPAGLEERRFAVLDVADAKLQDHAYFGALVRQMEQEGGDAALLHHLLTLDLSGVDLRTIPTTDALREQKVASLTSEQKWWLDRLMSGVLPSYDPGTRSVPTEALHEHYLDHARGLGYSHRSSATELGIALNALVPGLEKKRPLLRKGQEGAGHRIPHYRLPPLQACRAAFERLTKQVMAWPPSDQREGEPQDWGLWVPSL